MLTWGLWKGVPLHRRFLVKQASVTAGQLKKTACLILSLIIQAAENKSNFKAILLVFWKNGNLGTDGRDTI